MGHSGQSQQHTQRTGIKRAQSAQIEGRALGFTERGQLASQIGQNSGTVGVINALGQFKT